MRSSDCRILAMPEGALDVCSANLPGLRVRKWLHHATNGPGATNLARSFSSCLRLRFMAIILHVRFSNRSWFGSWVFVLLYNFHIWVPRGSFFCISSGRSRSGPRLKTASPSMSWRARWFSTERASLEVARSKRSEWTGRLEAGAMRMFDDGE